MTRRELPPEEHRLEAGHLPTPFSAEQIRAASRPGRSVAFLVEPPGMPAYVDRWEFLAGDESGAARRRWTETPHGEALELPEVVWSTWLSLQRHASYPAASTTIEPGRVETPAGAFDCWIYAQSAGDGSTTRVCFARSLPGPPVLVETERDGAIVFRMALIEGIPPG